MKCDLCGSAIKKREIPKEWKDLSEKERKSLMMTKAKLTDARRNLKKHLADYQPRIDVLERDIKIYEDVLAAYAMEAK